MDYFRTMMVRAARSVEDIRKIPLRFFYVIVQDKCIRVQGKLNERRDKYKKNILLISNYLDSLPAYSKFPLRLA